MHRALIAAAAVLACAPFAMSADQKPSVQYRIDREGGGEKWMSSEPVYSTSYDRDWRDDRGTRSDVTWQDRDMRGRECEGGWQDREGRGHQGDVNTRRAADMRSNEMRDRSMDRNVSRAERESGQRDFRDTRRDPNMNIETPKSDVNIRSDKRSDADMRLDANRNNQELQGRASTNADEQTALELQNRSEANFNDMPAADVSFQKESDLKDRDLSQCTFDFTPGPIGEQGSKDQQINNNAPQNVNYERDTKLIEAPIMHSESTNQKNESHGTKPAVQYRLNRER